MVMLDHLKVLHNLIRIKLVILILVPTTSQVALSVCRCVARILKEERISIFSLLGQVVPILSWLVAEISARTYEICYVSPNTSVFIVKVAFINLGLDILFVFFFLCFFASSFYPSNLDC